MGCESFTIPEDIGLISGRTVDCDDRDEVDADFTGVWVKVHSVICFAEVLAEKFDQPAAKHTGSLLAPAKIESVPNLDIVSRRTKKKLRAPLAIRTPQDRQDLDDLVVRELLGSLKLESEKGCQIVVCDALGRAGVDLGLVAKSCEVLTDCCLCHRALA